MKKNFYAVFILGMTLVAAFQGCSKKSYPSDRVREAVLDICHKEYGIHDVQVQLKGDTIGVYLPLPKIFAADFKETAVTGKVRNMDTLFEPAPETLEKIEDVWSAISRVLLSTDRPLQFYVLEATDTEKTGMQLLMMGSVEDIKRVKALDISQGEYRKRVSHELKLNHAVLWHKPVREFYKDISDLPVEEVRKKYFGESLNIDTLQRLFLDGLWDGKGQKSEKSWEIKDIRSAAIQKNQILVYTKVTSPREPSQDLQYIFMISLTDDKARIVRIIPFQFRDDKGEMQRISFPKELQVQDSLEHWEVEFELDEIKMGPFLAAQLTRRVQSLLASDERIQNTFRDFKSDFEYHEEPNGKPFFSLDLEASLKDLNHYSRKSPIFHEDMLYLLTLASREFVNVLRSYRFGFDYLRLNVAQDPNTWILGRNDLELFRRKKIDLQGLLSVPRF